MTGLPTKCRAVPLSPPKPIPFPDPWLADAKPLAPPVGPVSAPPTGGRLGSEMLAFALLTAKRCRGWKFAFGRAFTACSAEPLAVAPDAATKTDGPSSRGRGDGERNTTQQAATINAAWTNKDAKRLRQERACRRSRVKER